jgi:predicted ATPase
MPTPLPLSLGRFIGRERELRWAKDLLAKRRFVTLLGPGGLGKTRLALQLAVDVADDYADGVFFIPLDAIRDPALVLTTIAYQLGVTDKGDQPLHKSLHAFLRDKHVLLVLDNFEQVTRAAPRVAELLAAAPHLKILVTSRAPLNTRGEHIYEVPPLALPESRIPSAPDELLNYSAIALFVSRAHTHRPGFALDAETAPYVVEICARLDGLPLALELAAAQIKTLPAHRLAEQLDRRFQFTNPNPQLLAHQQTLHTLIGWSYDLLNDAERELFRRLAVFAGGWDAESAGAVLGAAGADLDFRLSPLVAQSLIIVEARADQLRYRTLDTIREYARERLTEGGEADALSRQHAEYFLNLARQAEEELTGEHQAHWLNRLDREHDNFRAALEWAVNASEAGLAQMLCSRLCAFWQTRGYLSEGRNWLTRALALDEQTTGARADALNAAGNIAWSQGDYTAARAWHETGLALRRELGDVAAVARSLHNIGIVAMHQGDYAAAQTHHTESLTIKRELGNTFGIANSLNELGILASAQGDVEQAIAYHTESLALRRELGDTQGVAISLINLGALALHHGQWERARAECAESLALFREVGDKDGTAIALANLGRLAAQNGDDAQAATHLRDSLRLFAEVGNRGRYPLCLEELAGVARRREQFARAAQLFGAAATIAEGIGFPLLPEHRGLNTAQDLTTLCTQMTTAEFETAWETGRAMPEEQAIKYALG